MSFSYLVGSLNLQGSWLPIWVPLSSARLKRRHSLTFLQWKLCTHETRKAPPSSFGEGAGNI